MPRLTARLIVFLLCLLAPAAHAQPAADPAAEPLIAYAARIAGDDARTRVVIDFDRKPEFTLHYTAEPNRLIIDLGETAFGCACGEVFCDASRNWKDHVGRTELTGEDLGAKVRLHPELVADGYACPGCGSLLAVEVRWRQDEPLHEMRVSPV